MHHVHKQKQSRHMPDAQLIMQDVYPDTIGDVESTVNGSFGYFSIALPQSYYQDSSNNGDRTQNVHEYDNISEINADVNVTKINHTSTIVRDEEIGADDASSVHVRTCKIDTARFII